MASPKSVLIVGDKKFQCKPPYQSATFADVTGWACECGSNTVNGRGMHHDHDTYRATAYCGNCRVKVGQLEAKVDTLFGIEEDIAVLNGRCRVY